MWNNILKMLNKKKFYVYICAWRELVTVSTFLLRYLVLDNPTHNIIALQASYCFMLIRQTKVLENVYLNV